MSCSRVKLISPFTKETGSSITGLILRYGLNRIPGDRIGNFLKTIIRLRAGCVKFCIPGWNSPIFLLSNREN